MLTPMAWAFTRLRQFGVWRHLGNVDEVNSPRFLFVYASTLSLHIKRTYQERTIKQPIIMKKQLLFLLFSYAFIGLYAQTYTVYTSIKPRFVYHASPDCPNLKGDPMERKIDFSNELKRSDKKLVENYFACSTCKPINLSLVKHGITRYGEYDLHDEKQDYIVSYEDSIDAENAITIIPQGMITSSNVIASHQVLFFVHDAIDKALIGCPVVCKIIQVRKSNISGSEGRMVIRPLYIDKKGEKIN